MLPSDFKKTKVPVKVNFLQSWTEMKEHQTGPSFSACQTAPYNLSRVVLSSLECCLASSFHQSHWEILAIKVFSIPESFFQHSTPIAPSLTTFHISLSSFLKLHLLVPLSSMSLMWLAQCSTYLITLILPSLVSFLYISLMMMITFLPRSVLHIK